jgi:hypothetical protein
MGSRRGQLEERQQDKGSDRALFQNVCHWLMDFPYDLAQELSVRPDEPGIGFNTHDYSGNIPEGTVEDIQYN